MPYFKSEQLKALRPEDLDKFRRGKNDSGFDFSLNPAKKESDCNILVVNFGLEGFIKQFQDYNNLKTVVQQNLKLEIVSGIEETIRKLSESSIGTPYDAVVISSQDYFIGMNGDRVQVAGSDLILTLKGCKSYNGSSDDYLILKRILQANVSKTVGDNSMGFKYMREVYSKVPFFLVYLSDSEVVDISASKQAKQRIVEVQNRLASIHLFDASKGKPASLYRRIAGLVTKEK